MRPSTETAVQNETAVGTNTVEDNSMEAQATKRKMRRQIRKILKGIKKDTLKFQRAVMEIQREGERLRKKYEVLN